MLTHCIQHLFLELSNLANVCGYRSVNAAGSSSLHPCSALSLNGSSWALIIILFQWVHLCIILNHYNYVRTAGLVFFIVNKSHLFYVPFNLVKIPNDDYGLQLRQPAPGIQNIGMIGSLNASQMRPPAISSPQQPRSGLPSSTTPSPSGNQMPGSQEAFHL